MGNSGRAKLVKVEVSLPFVKGTWVADRDQQQAAWEMYVELVTRITTQELGPSDGFLREALASLHSLFAETRRILKEHGPGVASSQADTRSFAEIAVVILNRHVRPVLAEWHPKLEAHESKCPPGMSKAEHEKTWEGDKPLRKELDELRKVLTTYGELLAQACEVDSLHRKN